MIKSLLLTSIISITPEGVQIDKSHLSNQIPDKKFNNLHLASGNETPVCQSLKKSYEQFIYADDQRKSYKIRRNPLLFTTLVENGFTRENPTKLPEKKFNRFNIFKPFKDNSSLIIVTKLIEPAAKDYVFYANSKSNLESVIIEASKSEGNWIRWKELVTSYEVTGVSETPLYETGIHDQGYDANFIWKYKNDTFVFDTRHNARKPEVKLIKVATDGKTEITCKLSFVKKSPELDLLRKNFNYLQKTKSPLSTYKYRDALPDIFGYYALTNPWATYPKNSRQVESQINYLKKLEGLLTDKFIESNYANTITTRYINNINNLYFSLFEYYKQLYAINENTATELAANAIYKIIIRSFSISYNYDFTPNSFDNSLLVLYSPNSSQSDIETAFQNINSLDQEYDQFKFAESLIIHPELLNKKLSDAPKLSEIKNGYNKTLLMVAAHSNQLNSTKTIFNTTPSLLNEVTQKPKSSYMGRYSTNRGFRRDNRTALMYAAENASDSLIDYLIKSGANLSLTDTAGNTFLA